MQLCGCLLTGTAACGGTGHATRLVVADGDGRLLPRGSPALGHDPVKARREEIQADLRSGFRGVQRQVRKLHRGAEAGQISSLSRRRGRRGGAGCGPYTGRWRVESCGMSEGGLQSKSRAAEGAARQLESALTVETVFRVNSHPPPAVLRERTVELRICECLASGGHRRRACEFHEGRRRARLPAATGGPTEFALSLRIVSPRACARRTGREKRMQQTSAQQRWTMMGGKKFGISPSSCRPRAIPRR